MALELMWVAIIMLAAQINSALRPECPTTCGNLTIPFPFGTSSECHHQDSDSFLIICNNSYNPPKPFLNLGSSSAEVLEVSIDGLIKVSSSVASDCYSKSGSQISSTISELTSSKFPLSSTRNKFTAVGCDTYALVEGSNEWKNMSAGCVSWCDTAESVINGTCSGSGCCQTTIPKGVKDFFVDIRSFRNHTMVKGFNPCGYAFVVESEAFEFSSLDLKDLRNRKTFPVILDWSIGSETCTMARENLSSYACRATESKCSDSRNGLSYTCNCLSGYQGNPYIIDGCQDIDECATSKPCEGICKNLQGNYSCSCAEGFEGDGMKNGSGCHPKIQMKGSTLFYITSGFMIPAIGSSWIFWRRKQKKLVKLRQNVFQRNGGLVLENMLRIQDTLVIFTAEELKRATDNYDENRIIHSGNAYKGLMSVEGVNRLVTIKKCNRVDESQIEVFINKLVTLSRLHHKNLVKLIGCCLETQVPLLVYEFITVTALDDFIPFNAASLSWDIRLRIASETAGALAYMHSAAEILPITHGNFSSSSILLHHDYTAKVHDFACDVPSYSQVSHLDPEYCDSGILTVDVPSYSQVSHLDPEYCYSGILTAKSDVYSFGTVLAELLTGKKWSNIKRQVGEEYFVSSSNKNELNSILDQRWATEGKIEQLTEIAKLAGRCLSESSLERPTMKQVEMALISACNGSSSSTAIRQISSLKTTARRLMRRNRSL